MKNRLLVLGCFVHDPERILAAVGKFALVGVERRLDSLLGIGLELRIAAFANADYWRGLFDDPQLALWHDFSLAQSAGGAECL